MQHVDVAVVGGGPAGTSAGRAAAEAGAETLVVEKGVPRADRDGPGPDSTDAAGILDYWVDIMGFAPDEIPEWVKCRELHGADFIGPTESVRLTSTGMDASYPNFGFTMHRSKFDDWLTERAIDAGVEYVVGNGVRSVESDPSGGWHHTLTLRDGTEYEADHLVLADGPQRTVTKQVLEPLLPTGGFDRLAAPRANHIAYQEYREFPEELLETDVIKFWWGYMPGHTAYPWVFPNDGRVARVGLTMPIGMDIDAVENRDEYLLLRPEDERIPQGKVYIERLLDHLYPDYDADDFPFVTDRGKTNGTETYPISSTRPIESPTAANVAVVGGAMGATSAFHEGGDHVAVRTGKIAGHLAARGNLSAYNAMWQDAIGDEVLRNVALADMAEGYGPADWDRTFGIGRRMLDRGSGYGWRDALSAGVGALGLVARYKWTKYGLRDGGYIQLKEDEYAV